MATNFTRKESMCKRNKMKKILKKLTKYTFFEKMLVAQTCAQKLMHFDHLELFPDATSNTVLPWEIEAFTELSILSTGNNPTKSFKTHNSKAFCKIITSIRNFLPPKLEEEMGTPKFANDFFMACGMVQFKPQKYALNRLYRYDYFWSFKNDKIDMPKIFSDNFNGLSYEHFIELAILTYFAASMDGNSSNIFRYISMNHFDAIKLLCITREDYIERQTEKNANDINNVVYGFNYLYPYPYIEFNANIYLPVPYLIIDAVCESLITRVTNGNDRIREDIGKHVAQSYIEYILKDGNVYEEVVPEIRYMVQRQPIDAPDVMIKDGNKFCFIDSKLSTPKLSLRHFNETDIEKNIKQYAKNVRQIYNRIVDFLDGKYYPFTSLSNIDKSKVFGLVIVFENAFIFKSRILTEVFNDLNIDSKSAEAQFIKSNIHITDLSDIESFAFGSYNIFTALESKRDDNKRWEDMGLYSNEMYTHEPTKSKSLLSFESKMRNILKEHLARMMSLQLIPAPTTTSSY